MKGSGFFASSVTAALIIAQLAGVTGCTSKNGDSEIDKDSPWFDYTSITSDEFAKREEGEEVTCEYLHYKDGKHVLFAMGSKEIPDDFDYVNGDIEDFYSYDILVIDTEGNEVGRIDLKQFATDGYSIGNVTDAGDNVQAVFDDGESDMRRTVIIDPITGETVSDEKSEYVWEAESSYEGEDIVEGHRVGVVVDWSSDMPVYSVVVDDGEEAVLQSDEEIYSVISTVPAGTGKALITTITSGDNGYYMLDLESGSVSKCDPEEISWLTDNVTLSSSEAVRSSDDALYLKNESGVVKVDFNARTCQTLFDFNYTYCSRYDLNNMEPVYCTGDSVVYAGDATYYRSYTDDNSEKMTIYTFTRAAENPNAGKTELKLYSPNGLEWNTAKIISNFNSESENYLVTLDTRYKFSDYYEENSENFNLNDINMRASMSDKLAVDIMNGEGPDILLDCASFGQLANDSYLADLSDLASEFNESCFGNVFECARDTSGKIYQLPYAVDIRGILTNGLTDKTGFTYDEYAEFVNDTCNGVNPISMSQTDFLLECFCASNDLYLTENGYNFSGEEFAALAEYVAEHVTESSSSANAEDYSEPAAEYADISDFGYLFYSDYDSFLGIPSADGRGPALVLSKSIAISAQTASIEGCSDFVRQFLSDNAQAEIGYAGNIPVNRTAFDIIGSAAVDYYKDSLYTEDEPNRDNSAAYSAKIDLLRSTIESANHARFEDYAISKIIYEEMPAYFEGQKDIAAVAEIMEDRTGTVLAER